MSLRRYKNLHRMNPHNLTCHKGDTMSDTFSTIQNLAANKFNIDASILEPNQDIFQALKINSVDVLSLLTDLENHFGIEIPDYELQDVKTFQELVNVINERI